MPGGKESLFGRSRRASHGEQCRDLILRPQAPLVEIGQGQLPFGGVFAQLREYFPVCLGCLKLKLSFGLAGAQGVEVRLGGRCPDQLAQRLNSLAGGAGRQDVTGRQRYRLEENLPQVTVALDEADPLAKLSAGRQAAEQKRGGEET